MTYNWDLDNDGQFDDASGETPLVPWTSLGFAAPSSHTIKVKVSDGNLEAIAEATVDVKLPEVSLVFWNGGMFEWKPACINGSLRVYRSGPTTNALPVTLSIPSVMPNILNLATQGSTPGSDYTIASLSVSIPVGEDFVEVPVTVNNDLLVEGDEIVVVRLASSLLYTSSNGEVQGTIVDNDRWDWDYTPPNWGWGTTASYHTWGDGSSLWSYIGAGRESASTVSATVSGDFDPFIGFDRHVELDLELSFDINESTGVITMDTPNPTPGVTQDGSLSCGFGWSVNIDQTTHLATVSFSTLTVYAGGTVTMTAVTPPGVRRDYRFGVKL